MNLSTPMFKEFKEEKDALEAVERMKTKFSPTCINVINPYPQGRHTLSATDYGLPEENICYEGLQQSYQSKLISCGFNATEITQLEREIQEGTLLVIVCQ